MKSIFLFFAVCIFFLNNIVAQNAGYTVKVENGIPLVIFKEPKIKEEYSKPKDKQRVIVPAGKMVILTLIETIDSEQVTVGQNVQFIVDMNVLEDGEMVVRSNAYALGKVKRKKNDIQRNSCESTLTLEVFSVQAVDGQQIPLNGQEKTFVCERPGLSVIIPVGKKITGTFKNNETISIR